MSFQPITRVFKSFNVSSAPPAYGSFSSTTTQTIPQSSEYLVSHNITEVGQLITLTSPTDITVAEAGEYYINFSAQLDKVAGGGTSAEIDMYIKINGTAVPRSATKIELSNNVEFVMCVDYIVSIPAGGVLQVAAYSSASTTRLLAVPQNIPVPAIPSIITNILRIAS